MWAVAQHQLEISTDDVAYVDHAAKQGFAGYARECGDGVWGHQVGNENLKNEASQETFFSSRC